MRKVSIYIFNIMFVCLLAACGTKVSQTEPKEPETTIENIWQEEVKHDDVEESNIPGNKMEYQFDEIMGIDTLELNYEAHAAGFDGECFTFTIYFEEAVTDENLAQINKAVDDFAASYNEKGIYIGYIDVSQKDDNAFIYLDLGNVGEEDCNTSIHGILMALNNIPGIRTVILNE